MTWAVGVGAGLGYAAIGGPVGAAIGLGYGIAIAVVEKLVLAQMPDPIGIEIEALPDEDGVSVKVTARDAVADGTVAVVHVLEEKKHLIASADAYADSSDHFVAAVRFIAGSARVYVPFGAMEYTQKGSKTLRVAVVDGKQEQPEVLGRRQCDVEFGAPRAWTMADVVKPFLALAASVAKAGRVPNEGLALANSLLSTRLGLAGTDLTSAASAVGTVQEKPVPVLMEDLAKRLPMLGVEELVEMLSEIARSSGAPTERAVK
jgi:hypothetical protein